MKKTVLIGITILLSINNLYSQKQEKIKVPRVNSSIYKTTIDSTEVSFKIAEKVALNMNMKKYHENAYSKSYKCNTGSLGIYSTAFISEPLKPAINAYIKTFDNKLDLKQNEQVYLYGFTSALAEGKKADRNYSRMMMSAYKQEMDLDYLNNSNNFITLKQIEKSEYWKRNWINMGYGMSYIAKDNPFMGSKGFAVGFFYLWEALHYIPIFGGAFFGETQQDKVAIPLIGLTSLIVWKGMIGGISSKYIKMNKDIHKSGYKVPNNLEF